MYKGEPSEEDLTSNNTWGGAPKTPHGWRVLENGVLGTETQNKKGECFGGPKKSQGEMHITAFGR